MFSGEFSLLRFLKVLPSGFLVAELSAGLASRELLPPFSATASLPEYAVSLGAPGETPGEADL